MEFRALTIFLLFLCIVGPSLTALPPGVAGGGSRPNTNRLPPGENTENNRPNSPADENPHPSSPNGRGARPQGADKPSGAAQPGGHIVPATEGNPQTEQETNDLWDLGLYSIHEQAPFLDLFGGDHEWVPYYDKMGELLTVIKEEPVDDNSGGSDGENGSPRGQTRVRTFTVTKTLNQEPTAVTSIFNPSHTTEACNAMSTLQSYCGNGGPHCNCFSSTFYVPDQWNSIAARCASYECPDSSSPGKYCKLAKAASTSTGFCAVRGEKSFAFGAVSATPTPHAKPATTSNSAPTKKASSTVARDADVTTDQVTATSSPTSPLPSPSSSSSSSSLSSSSDSAAGSVNIADSTLLWSASLLLLAVNYVPLHGIAV